MATYLPFFMSLCISTATMPFIIKIAKKFSIYDKPDFKRKIHKSSIPLLGGVAIYLGFISAFLIFARIDTRIIGFVITSFAIFIMGLLDDMYDIPAIFKMLIELGCALYIAISIDRLDIGQYLLKKDVSIAIFDIIVSALWIAGVINAINIVDGVDGLAGGVSAIVAIGFVIIGFISNNQLMVVLALSLLGSIIGFLFYNKNPARVFMGDAGSTFLGYILSILSIMSVNTSNNKASIVAPILILGVPLFDTGCAILRRFFNKKNIFSADNDHIHHRLLNMGYSQKKTVYVICSISILFVAVGVIIYIGHYFTIGLSLILFLIILGTIMSLYESHVKQSTAKHEVAATSDSTPIAK